MLYRNVFSFLCSGDAKDEKVISISYRDEDRVVMKIGEKGAELTVSLLAKYLDYKGLLDKAFTEESVVNHTLIEIEQFEILI